MPTVTGLAAPNGKSSGLECSPITRSREQLIGCVRFPRLLLVCVLVSTSALLLLNSSTWVQMRPLLSTFVARQLASPALASTAASSATLPIPSPKHQTPLTRGFSSEERSRLSRLGRVLFLQEPPPPQQRRNFTVAVWRHGQRIARRLLASYTQTARAPLDGCAVQNCHVFYTEKEADLEKADAVLFHLQFTGSADRLAKRRNADQRWIFLSDESPRHAFTTRNITAFNGVFNWSMAYRFDTDIPVPYGRTVLGQSPPVRQLNKTKLAAVMGSNCDKSGRWQAVKRLKPLITLDTYGGCGELKCPGHYDKDCELLDDYKFYLSFENSHCDGYITEKLFWQAVHKGAIPVVFGAPRADYEKVLPPNSYIFAEDFGSVEELASFLLRLDKTPREYGKYHAWREQYTVLNEHGYFGAPIHYYCRICEALNYNSGERKVYTTLDQFWGAREHCSAPDKSSLFGRLK